ncbi:FecR family protein [bacterium A37T11]|nr:FecR family protein [bacterium A37T11]
MQKDYHTYELIDFLTDENFKEWILHPGGDPTVQTYWHSVLSQLPSPKQKLADEAAAVICSLRQPALPDGQASQQTWDQIARSLFRETPAEPPQSLRRAGNRLTWLYIAAAVCLAIGFSLFLYKLSQPTVSQYQTAYGEQKEIMLPDRSTVLLGANSRLRVHTGGWRHPREAWLDGQAHFQVAHIHRNGTPLQPNDRFVVYTSQGGIVEVLGTKFSVWQQATQTQVTLESGSVHVSYQQQQRTLRPGETVEMQKEKGLSLRNIMPALHYLWESRELRMDNAPIGQVIRLAEETFGRSIRLQKPDASQQTLDGTIPFDSLSHVSTALEALSGSSILINPAR